MNAQILNSMASEGIIVKMPSSRLLPKHLRGSTRPLKNIMMWVDTSIKRVLNGASQSERIMARVDTTLNALPRAVIVGLDDND
ncbi:MAG: hypothetical protein COY40_03280 [Alphaproteobacteria bacterium CG_4_10_14_0_8_um_filter_53_9]|nr:MAG: hypothetical protein COY40_03280 [Alphaproteobacteria bacterium CG_4_10_14_0_8_um_filter_53_9]